MNFILLRAEKYDLTWILLIFGDFSDPLGTRVENYNLGFRDSFYSRLRGYQIYLAGRCVFWIPQLTPKSVENNDLTQISSSFFQAQYSTCLSSVPEKLTKIDEIHVKSFTFRSKSRQTCQKLCFDF